MDTIGLDDETPAFLYSKIWKHIMLRFAGTRHRQIDTAHTVVYFVLASKHPKLLGHIFPRPHGRCTRSFVEVLQLLTDARRQYPYAMAVAILDNLKV